MQNFFEKFQALPKDLQDQIITFTEYLEMKQKRDEDAKLKIAHKSGKKE